MQRTKLLILLGALSFFPTLWFYTVGEEGIYTLGSMEMWQSKDWLIQTVYGVNQQRPPLMSWLVIGIANLIGWSHVQLATRAVSAAATLGMIGWLYWLCRRLMYDRAFALFTALACLSLADLLLYRGWLAYTDPLFSFFIFGAMATLWVGSVEQRRKLLLASVVLISCALLTKALTAYVFYGTAAFVLLLHPTQRRFLLSPASLLALALIVVAPIVWLTSIPQLSGQGTSLVAEIQHKLSDVDLADYFTRLVIYPFETALRLAPASLIALYLLLRRRHQLQPDGAPRNFRTAWLIAALSILPYWLVPHGGIRYILPAFPFVALVCASLIWRAGASTQSLALKWFGGMIALKFVLALIVFPYYQSHYRGENYSIAGHELVKKTSGYPVYDSYDCRDVAESVVTQINIDRWPQATVRTPPANWDNGFLLSQDTDERKGRLVERIRLGADEIYLLCRGAACQSPALTKPSGKGAP